MLECKFCGKGCKNDNSLRNHQRLCKLNPDRQTVNIDAAREEAYKKCKCQYCGEEVAKVGIKKHEKHCKSNPEVIKTKGKICPVCGTLFISESITCSYSCSNTHFRSGDNNPNWKEGRYQTTCWHHHKKECVVCGENKIVAVHHYDHNHHNNEPSNLVPLCPTHHGYIHSRYAGEVQHIVDEYVEKFISV